MTELTQTERDAMWTAPWETFVEPTEIVDETRLEYAFRLRLLQHWLSLIASGTEGAGRREDVEAAIFALEARAKLKTDAPEDAPAVHNYGGVQRSDLRTYSLGSLARHFWRFVRNR